MQVAADVTINALSHSIQLAIAPVFLLTGVAGFLNVLNARLVRVVDRTRVLETSDGDSPEMPVLLRRRHAINRAITLCTLCAVLICVVIVLMFLGIVIDIELAQAVAFLFIAAMAALITGLLHFLREVQLAVRFIRRGVPLGLVLLALCAAPAFTQTLPAPVRAAADRITAEQLKRDLDYLSDDRLLGRNTPSPGFDTAAAYIARRLQTAGLKPLGDDGTFFQHYDLRDERIDTAAAYIEVDGRRFAFGDDFIMRSFAGPLAGEYPVVYAGQGWTVPSAGIDPFAGVDVRGAIVLVHGGEVPPRNAAVQQIGRVTVGGSSPYTEAQRRGAAGIIFIAQPATLNGWDRLRRSNVTRLELHPIVPSAYAAPALTAINVKGDVVDALLAGDRIGGAELVQRGAAGAQPQSFALARRLRVHIPPASSVTLRPYNILAMIEGSDSVLKHEYVTIESHLDGSVGSAAQDGDGIYNSADDNASGSAGTLAIAEQLMRAPRPKRSLIFIWDSGEERGLWGTRHFVHAPPVPLDAIVAHFNVDMIGATRAPGMPDSASADVTGPNEVYITGPAVLSPSIDSLLVRVNRQYLGMTFNRDFDRADNQFFYPRTDAGPFLERGILTIGFQTGLHNRYHAPRDEAQYLDPSKMEAISRMVLASVWMVANGDSRPRIEVELPASVPRYFK